MLHPLIRLGHPLLRQVAADVTSADFANPDFKQLVEDMRECMKHYGGIGLAAPQIGFSLQLAVIELEAGKNRYDSDAGLPFTVFINPVTETLDQTEQGFWEGCLSVPGLRGFVERPRKIRVTYQTLDGQPAERIAEGFLATVVQHELDHLQGLLYVDRLKDTRLLSFQEEFAQFHGQAPSLDEDDV